MLYAAYHMQLKWYETWLCCTICALVFFYPFPYQEFRNYQTSWTKYQDKPFSSNPFRTLPIMASACTQKYNRKWDHAYDNNCDDEHIYYDSLSRILMPKSPFGKLHLGYITGLISSVRILKIILFQNLETNLYPSAEFLQWKHIEMDWNSWSCFHVCVCRNSLQCKACIVFCENYPYINHVS